MRHAGQRRGPILRRADALWIISMNIREYTLANYHGVYIRWLSVTLANAFDWMRYQRRPWKFSWFELLGVCTRAHARIRAQNCTLEVWTVQRMHAYARVFRARSMNPAIQFTTCAIFTIANDILHESSAPSEASHIRYFMAQSVPIIV